MQRPHYAKEHQPGRREYAQKHIDEDALSVGTKEKVKEFSAARGDLIRREGTIRI